MSEPSIRDIVAEALPLIQRFEDSNTKDAAQAREIQSAFESLYIRHGFKKIKELKNHLEAYLPGLFGYLKTKDSQKKDVLLGLSLNLNLRGVSEVFSKLATHSLKLSNPAAFGRAPIDTTEVFELSDTLVGSHVVPMDARYDCSANAALTPYLRQVRHALANKGRYILPSGLASRDLPESVLTHIAGIEAVVGRTDEQSVQPVHYGVPQVLLPDADSKTGYISVTPAACSGVITLLTDRLAERGALIAHTRKANKKLAQRAKSKRGKSDDTLEPQPVPGAVPHTRKFMKAVSNLQNLSQTLRAGSAVLIACPPVDDAAKRRALQLAHDPPKWIATTLRRHIFKNDRVGENLRKFSKLFEHMNSASSTNASERRRLTRHVRFFSAVLVDDLNDTARKHHALIEKQVADLPDDVALANAIAQQINAHLSFAAEPALVAEWADEALNIIRARKEGRHVAHA